MPFPCTCPASSPAPSPAACCRDDVAWVRAYLVSHSSLMDPRSRYCAYIFWIITCVITITVTLVRVLNINGGVLGGLSNMVLLGRTKLPVPLTRLLAGLKCRRIGTPYPMYFPSNGRLLGVLLFTGLVGMLIFVGLDVPDPPFDIAVKYWWIPACRMGIMAFALFPLCILFSLKGSPFAVFSYKFLTQLYFDKLAWLHRWSAGLIWLLTACHVGLWSTQLIFEKHPASGDMVFSHVWHHRPFMYGWTAFFLLTFLIIMSLKPIRTHHYEVFYACHVLLAPLMLITAALHHRNMWIWSWSALAIWVGERLWRAARYFHMNVAKNPCTQWHHRFPAQPTFDRYIPLQSAPIDSMNLSTWPSGRHAQFTGYLPPPGFAHAEIVAGTTVRLTYVPRREVVWAPGQYFLINIPSVSRFTTHPFTSASSYDFSEVPVFLFLIRVKNGFTRNLWNHVINLCSKKLASLETNYLDTEMRVPGLGVLLKMNVDGPFGSAERVKWGSFSGAVIVVGGSGVSYGLSILEHICRLIGQRKRNLEENSWIHSTGIIRRVKFIWIVREYGNIQWAASSLRRCKMIATSSELDISIYVTHPNPESRVGPATELQSEPLRWTAGFKPSFILNLPEQHPQTKITTSDDVVSGTLQKSDASPMINGYNAEEEQDSTDLATFEGDETVRLPGEGSFSKRVKQESRVRRSQRHRRSISSEIAPGPIESQIGALGAPESYFAEPGFVSKPTPVATPRRSSDNREREAWTSSPLGNSNIVLAKGAPRHCADLTIHTFAEERPRPVNQQGGSTAGRIDTGFQLQVSESEMQDIFVLSEFARKGKPKLERILREEVYSAEGPIVVACCGPASLNTMVRRCVVAQTNLGYAWRKAGRGHISFVSEEFDY